MSMSQQGLRIAIAGLVRGYQNISDYSSLIARNRALKQFVSANERKSLNVEFIIFHEGNLPPEHQDYITLQSGLRIQFVNVECDFNANLGGIINPDPRIFPTRMSQAFPLGYKMMCRFWFDGFIKYLTGFDYLIRVDEDCEIIEGSLSDVIDACLKEDVAYSCPMWIQGDHEDVVVGLDKIVDEFRVANHMLARVGELPVPMTCVSLLNIKRFASLPLLSEFREVILQKQGIFINRWGDAPLWGYMLELEPLNLKAQRNMLLAYAHGSHYTFVNLSPTFSQKFFMIIRRRRDRIRAKIRKFFGIFS